MPLAWCPCLSSLAQSLEGECMHASERAKRTARFFALRNSPALNHATRMQPTARKPNRLNRLEDAVTNQSSSATWLTEPLQIERNHRSMLDFVPCGHSDMEIRSLCEETAPPKTLNHDGNSMISEAQFVATNKSSHGATVALQAHRTARLHMHRWSTSENEAALKKEAELTAPVRSDVFQKHHGHGDTDTRIGDVAFVGSCHRDGGASPGWHSTLGRVERILHPGQTDEQNRTNEESTPWIKHARLLRWPA